MVQALKLALREVRLVNKASMWEDEMATIVMGYRMSTHESLAHFSLYYLLFWRQVMLGRSVSTKLRTLGELHLDDQKAWVQEEHCTHAFCLVLFYSYTVILGHLPDAKALARGLLPVEPPVLRDGDLRTVLPSDVRLTLVDGGNFVLSGLPHNSRPLCLFWSGDFDPVRLWVDVYLHGSNECRTDCFSCCA